MVQQREVSIKVTITLHGNRKMKYTILHLVKFFEKEEFADQFLQGKLYLNKLRNFKNLEQTEADGRPDANEAVAIWLQKEGTSVEFREHPELNIAPENLAGPVRVLLQPP